MVGRHPAVARKLDDVGIIRGHKIYLEDGNEAWNSGMGATLYHGNGMAYGYTLGPNMAAAKSAEGYAAYFEVHPEVFNQ